METDSVTIFYKQDVYNEISLGWKQEWARKKADMWPDLANL